MSPSELEGFILTHPAVADVGVVGKPDPVAGQLPMAWVVKKPGAEVVEEDILNFVAGKKPGAEVVEEDIVNFVTGKKPGAEVVEEDIVNLVAGEKSCPEKV